VNPVGEKSIHSIQVNQSMDNIINWRRSIEPDFGHVSSLKDFSKPGCEVLGPLFYYSVVAEETKRSVRGGTPTS
jgi:hypothetical protein